VKEHEVTNDGDDTHDGRSSVIGSRLDSIVSWFKEKLGKAPPRAGGMLLDDDPKPAGDAMSWMQEGPRFDVDEETKREFAVLDDLADRRVEKLSEARPSFLREPEPDEAR
jgi:hypothetical protein